MNYEEYKKSVGRTSTAYEKYKQAVGRTTTPSINPVVSTLKNASVIQTANDVKAPVLTEETLKQQKNTNAFISSLKTPTIKPNVSQNKLLPQNVIVLPGEKRERQENLYKQIMKSDMADDLKTYVKAEKEFQNTLPELEEDRYLEYKSKAQQTEDMVEKAKYNVMAEKSKQHGDLYYGTTQTLKTIGTSLADNFVNAGQFVKNAFKSEMQKEIRDAWESIATFSNPNFKSRFKALRDISDENANKLANGQIEAAKKVLRKYNIQVPDDVNAEYARQMIADIDEWVYKENKLEEATRTAHEKVQQENQALGPFAKTVTKTADVVSAMGPTILTNTVLPGAGSVPMFLSSAQSSSEQALKEGATYEQAIQRGILSGGMEVATESIGGENLSKLTGIPTLFKKFGINTSNKLAQVLLDVGSEGLEEMVSTGVQPIIDRITYNPEAKFATASDYWQSFKDSILPTLFFVGVNQGTTAINNYKLKAIEKVEKSNMTPEQKQQAKVEIEKGAQEMIQQLNSQATSQNNTNLEETSPNTVQTEQNNVQNALDFEKTVQMEQSLGLQQSKEIPQAIQTFVENRNKTAPGLNIQFDNTLNTDGRIIRNPDGTRMISINPNSTRAYEFVVVHEMMHDLENTQEFQELSKYVKDRAITQEGFEKAKQAITEQYTKYYTENNLDMSELNMDVETTNDMVAQALGNQQFLNELAGNKPNVFMRLYNWIKNVAFDGNKTGKTFSERRADNKYLQELKNKFETAYRTSYNNSNAQNNYSIAGQKGLQNAINTDSRFKRLEDNLKRAQIMAQNNIDNEQIRRNTNWFQDKNGDWKFEFSDKDMSLKNDIILEENKNYKLENILEHDILFLMYPELRDYNIKFVERKNTNQKGKHDAKTRTISINSKLMNLNGWQELIEGTIVHELQHAIQNIEGFEKGKSSFSKTAYYNSLGEIEADDVKNRFLLEKYHNKKVGNIPPESSKANPIHRRASNLNNLTTIDKMKDKIYNSFEKYMKGKNDSYEETIQENSGKDIKLNKRTDDVGRRVKGLEDSSSFSFGKNILPTNNEWQKYLDKNWNLMPNANKTTPLMPSTEQLKAQDLKQGEEAYNTLNMKKSEETQLPSTMITKERLETERDTKISEIESKIKEKQQILQNKKRQDTKVAENLKTQIENLNKRKEDINQRYTEKIENFEYQKRKLQDEIVAEEKELEEEKVAEILDDTIAKKNNIKELAQDTVTTFKRMFVDSGADIAEIGKIANDKTLYHMYNSAKQAGQSANHMISEAQTNFQGDIVGKSLIDIFEPIRKKGQDYYKEFEYYMYHLHNIDRMNLKGKALDELRMFEIENPDFATLSQEELEKLAKQEIKEQSEIQIANEYLRLINKYEKTTDKPVFGESVTSEKSQDIVKQFESKYPEFKEYANEIRTWNTNLQQYRIDTGLISQEQADLMNEMYPNYVPTYRDRNGISGATKNGNTVRIVNTIKKATGSNKDILPLHEQMARQVMQTVQAGRRNILGMQLYNDVIKNADKLGKYVQEIKTTKEDTDIDAEFEFEKPELEGKFVIFDNGDRIEMQVSDGVLDGLKALTPAKWESNILSKGAKWINSKFKKLVTEWNPFFILKNASRDIQDAGFYSENAKKFYENYPQAWKEITSNSELWQKYLAMGGSDASLFDFEQGYVVPKDGIPAKTMQKISEANFLVEQAPRFAEFLRIYNQSDKSYNALMEAMYDAADITVNFGRSGTWGKFINNNLVPFFNPAVQGTSKTLRTITGDGNVKGAKNYAKHIANIVGKGVLLGVTPTMINHILLSVFGGDDYDDLNERDKDMYFLIPAGEGKYVKIPKGRVLSVIGGFARRGFDYAMGNKDAYKGFGKFALEQTAPSNPFENNLYSPIQAVKNNTTWYGTPIENESLQNLRPSQRYDEGTTEFAKGLGKTFNVSPKKVDYLLDAYGGVVADVLMPLNTKKAETSGFGKSFILDSTYSNKLSTDFYDTIEELTFDKNDDDPVAKMQLKYMNDVKEKAQDINKQIKDLQASDVENKEKLESVRELRKEVNTLQRDALATYEKYGEKANNYLKDDAFVQFALKGTNEDATEETKQSNIEKTVKAYTDKDLFGAEYALLEYNKDIANKQQEAKDKGIDADTFFKAYFAQKGIESDKNWKGETITNSKSKKQKEAIDKATPNLDKWERRTLYEIFNVGKSVW